MTSFERYLDDHLSVGQAFFFRGDALVSLGLNPQSFAAAVTRLKKKSRLATPYRGFYLILRPEDRVAGTPDPVTWIDPLMNYLKIDYRISLLKAAAFHGSSHQAAMVLQIIVPKQIRPIHAGINRLQFVYQSPQSFHETNRDVWLTRMKSPSGFAKVAGIELTLLDCARFFHRVGGISQVAQIAKDLGSKARSKKLAEAAESYENTAIRRLGYLLEKAGHLRQSKALEPFVAKAKSLKPLDPSVKTLPELSSGPEEVNSRWKLRINLHVEVDF